MKFRASKAESAVRLALIKVLRGPVCPSDGDAKAPGECFCKKCYFALQQPLRNLLFTKVDGTGEFEDYYVKALGDLKQRGLTRPVEKWSATARKIIEQTGLIAALVNLAAEKQKA